MKHQRVQPLFFSLGFKEHSECYVIKHVRPDNAFAKVLLFLGLSLDNCGLNLRIARKRIVHEGIYTKSPKPCGLYTSLDNRRG